MRAFDVKSSRCWDTRATHDLSILLPPPLSRNVNRMCKERSLNHSKVTARVQSRDSHPKEGSNHGLGRRKRVNGSLLPVTLSHRGALRVQHKGRTLGARPRFGLRRRRHGLRWLTAARPRFGRVAVSPRVPVMDVGWGLTRGWSRDWSHAV